MTPFRKSKFALFAATLAAAPVATFAHGPQIQIGIDNGAIVTRALFANESYQPPTPAQRVFQIPLTENTAAGANNGWYATPNAAFPFTGPGVALLDGHFAANSTLKVTFLEGLTVWNGSAFVDPGAEQLAVATSAAFTAAVLTKDAAPFDAVALAAVTATSDEHKTLRWRLLGDGAAPNTPSDDGVYRLKLRLATDQPNVAPSDPYYFLLAKNASPEDQSAALAATAALVPEPSALALLITLAIPAVRRRRR